VADLDSGDTGPTQADPLAQTDHTEQARSVEARRLRSNVKEALFGDAEPVRIGRYRLLSKIGQGGMGVVYRAHDESLDRVVAIKLLRPGGSGTGERLLREARSMARLAHPNIATVFDVGTHEDSVYLAMEFVDGLSLRVWLEQPRTFEQIRGVMVQAAAGLVAAHDSGVVHRDFKPDNVIVGVDGRVRVLDFGLAKLASSDLARSSDAMMTATGIMIGTPRYMAPEQLRQRAAGPGADQFAFCVTLYEAAYGQLPFEGDVFAEVAASVLGGAPLAPPEGETPEGLWPIIRRGLAREAEERFESLGALTAALEALPSPGDKIISRPALRDARVAARKELGDAFAESLLTADELDDRLERLENAVSPDTVRGLLADLQPEPRPTPTPVVQPPVVQAAAARVPVVAGSEPVGAVATIDAATKVPAVAEPPSRSRLSAIFSGASRAGHWQPARHNKVMAVFGGVDLDFRDVDFPPGETVLELQVLCGGIDIYVPPGIRIALESDAILAGVDYSGPSAPTPPDAPVLRITGFVLLGGVDVHERLSGEGSLGAWRRKRAEKKKRLAAKKDQKQLPPGDG